MYILVRADLPPGLQIAQVAHAAFNLAYHHPLNLHAWKLDGSESLVVLQVPDERTLRIFYDKLTTGPADCHAVIVREPDLGSEATAVACTPGLWQSKQFANLQLALSQPPSRENT